LKYLSGTCVGTENNQGTSEGVVGAMVVIGADHEVGVLHITSEPVEEPDLEG
jgi:hypothetical protein